MPKQPELIDVNVEAIIVIALKRNFCLENLYKLVILKKRVVQL